MLQHPDPVDYLLEQTGLWTLRMLLLTLAVTPLRKLTGWHGAVRLRRLLGLYAFFYSVLHFSTYLVFDQSLDLPSVVADVIDRPFIAVGFVAFVMMIPLAATSTNKMIKRLGGQRWQRLHQLVYLIGIAGALHFWWLAQSKADIREPFIYALILAVLLLMRHPPIMQRLQALRAR